MATDERDQRIVASPAMPNAGLVGGQRTVGDNARLTAVARRLALRFWQGGGDESYHFLLWMCADVVRDVWDATAEYDAGAPS